MNTTRITTWNTRRATTNGPLWDYFQTLSPHIALLQEVVDIPDNILQQYSTIEKIPIKKNDKPQSFKTVTLISDSSLQEIQLKGSTKNINKTIELYSGNIIACKTQLPNKQSVIVVNVYSPAWPINRTYLTDDEFKKLKLSQNDDLWLTDILLDAYKNTPEFKNSESIIAGDLNLSETFDSWVGGPRGNKEYLDRMKSVGLLDSLRHVQGVLTPTFKNPSNKKILHQMDHMFLTEGLLGRVKGCGVGEPKKVFDGNLSDHLPIVCDVEL